MNPSQDPSDSPENGKKQDRSPGNSPDLNANVTPESIEARANRWLAGEHVGVSSEALCRFFLGQEKNNLPLETPHDLDDVGRAIRLLREIPEWRGRLGELQQVSIRWGALAANWEKLEAAYDAGTDFREGGRLVTGIMNAAIDKENNLSERRRALLKGILNSEASRGRIAVENSDSGVRHIRVLGLTPGVAAKLANSFATLFHENPLEDFSVYASQPAHVKAVLVSEFGTPPRLYDRRITSQDFATQQWAEVCINFRPAAAATSNSLPASA